MKAKTKICRPQTSACTTLAELLKRRRASLADEALRRMSRELRAALPNPVQKTHGASCSRFAAALLCASFLWPSFALADLEITASMNIPAGTGNPIEEPSLLMNPEATLDIRPLFRLSVTAKDKDTQDASGRRWSHSRLVFTADGAPSQSAAVCTRSTNMQVDRNKDLTSNNFNPFEDFPQSARKDFQSIPPGKYRVSIEAYNSMPDCSQNTSPISNKADISSPLYIRPFMEIAAATISGPSDLQAGDKLDLNFTVENNRKSYGTSVARVEWLIAPTPPKPTASNLAAGMYCATPQASNGGFTGKFSSKLQITIPQDIDPGIHKLYLRVHDGYSPNTCLMPRGAITPLFTLADSIAIESKVKHIRMTPALPQPQPPIAVGMNGATVTWEVRFSHPVTGVDAKDFSLASTGVATPLSIASVTGSGDLYHVTTVVPAGSITPEKQASLRLDFIDDDSVVSVAGGRPVGGPGIGNGNFTGDAYALMGTICGAANTIWCDDFERTVQGESGPGTIPRSGMVGNGWTVESDHNACTSQIPPHYAQPDAGGCAGIDSDIKPYREYGANPRANRGRSMFNRWQQHSVTSKQIDLSGLPANSAVELGYWLRRGDDSFASVPLTTHAYIRVEYLDKNSTWQTLAYHRSATSKGTPGEILRPIFQLPEEALWQGFRLRFTQPDGRGFGDNSDPKRVNGYDYWFIDDVSLRRVDAPRYAGGFCDNFEAPTASLKQWSF
ncbi:MAG: hypothetical protein LBI68_10015, partial [Azoarcus sp.]|nr:hypothetical protein [Azoarcus sp.]